MKVKKPKRTTKGPVMKEDVLLIIQNYIRSIQMRDYGTDAGIPQLYHIMSLIEEMPLAEHTDAMAKLQRSMESYCAVQGFPENYLWE